MTIEHSTIWDAVESMARARNMSCSALARFCGLDATTFNKSKRWTNNGKPRWISTATLAKILNSTGTSVRQFAEFFPED